MGMMGMAMKVVVVVVGLVEGELELVRGWEGLTQKEGGGFYGLS